MLEPVRALDPTALTALAALEARVVAADGGRLKLEWGTLRSRTGDRDHDLLWWKGDRLVGFVGLYQFGAVLELAGMVDPAARRRGIGTALLDAAMERSRQRGLPRALLVVPGGSAGGAAMARRQGAPLHHSEHALVLAGEPVDGPADPLVTVRTATGADIDVVGRLLQAAFDWQPDDLAASLASAEHRTLLVERDGVGVGTLRVTVEDAMGDTVGGVYGFGVDPAVQGRGIGRDVLRRVCRELRAGGAERVALEVAVDNVHALGLYSSLGFVPVATEDYYELSLT